MLPCRIFWTSVMVVLIVTSSSSILVSCFRRCSFSSSEHKGSSNSEISLEIFEIIFDFGTILFLITENKWNNHDSKQKISKKLLTLIYKTNKFWTFTVWSPSGWLSHLDNFSLASVKAFRFFIRTSISSVTSPISWEQM